METSCQQNKQSSDKLEIPCGTKFLPVVIFAIFPGIRRIKFPQKKLTQKFSRKNLLQSKSYSD